MEIKGKVKRMKQENKELLLKDLCTRMPYGVKGIDCNGNISSPKDWKTEFHILTAINYRITKYEWRPYLFPLSSMTEEQKKEYASLVWFNSIPVVLRSEDAVILEEVPMLTDFYHKNYFDYRGLIPMGLAIDATGKNIY